jgi:tyrosinase
MQRRTFLSMVGGCVLAPAIAWSQVSPRTRRSATDPAARSDVDAFGRAAALMLQTMSATDPQSWLYWANVHGVPRGTSVPQSLRSIWGSCDHGDYFLAWHRLYLIYFESVISKLSGKADFAMPYWDWYASIDIPPAFTTPGDSSNSLWRDNRRYSKRYTVSTSVLGELDYREFNMHSFGDPHSPIHVNFLGEMSSPATAARDPIFWPHHVSMDRLWEVWRSTNASHQNPKPSDPWAAREFTFLAGSGGERAVSTVLDVAELGYQYDKLSVATQEAIVELLPAKPTRIETGGVVTQATEAASAVRVLSQKLRTSLRGDSLTVRLPVPAAAAPDLESLGTSLGAFLRLRLSDMRLTSEGESRGVLYNLYVNLPVKPGSQGTTRHRIGQISSFGLRQDGHAHSGHGSGMGSTVEFPITRLVPGLKAAGRWDPNMIEVDFIEPAGEQSINPLITIGQLELLSGRQ